MELIDKAAIVAEIDRRIRKYILVQQEPELSDLQKELQSKIDCLNSIKGYIINSLEAKEGDFNNELAEWMNHGPHRSYPWCTIPDAIKITAEHFYELGLNAGKEK